MEEKILRALQQIEKTYHVKILYACEAGSRSIGLESAESDYDIRFIYAEHINRYVSIDPIRKDVVELVEHKLDMSGWEITKALRLFRKSNPALLEWLHTKVVYVDPHQLKKLLLALQQKLFSKKACIYHYLNIVYKNKKEADTNKPIPVKQAIRIIHPLLMALHIKKFHVFPSGDFFDLIKYTANKQIAKEINALASKKRNNNGKKWIKLSQDLMDWIEFEVQALEHDVKELNEEKEDGTKELNQIFRDMLYKAWK